MGMSRLDVVAPEEGRNGKTYFQKIGVAWALKTGGFRLQLPPGVMVGSGVLLLAPKTKPGDGMTPPGEIPDEDIPF